MLGKRKYAGPASGAKRQTTARSFVGRNLTRTLLPPVRMGGNARAPARWAVRQGELKGVDTSLALSPVIATTNTNASAFTINLIPPGTASYNRVGRKTYPSSLRLFGEAFYTYGVAATTANVVGSQLRMVVVWDKQPGGAVPAFDAIFGHTLQDGTEASVFTDPLRYDNTDRFRVIRDFRKNVSPPASSPQTGTENDILAICPFDEYIPMKDLETVYSGQSSPCTIADLSSGALYVYFRATNSLGGVNSWAIGTNSFARFRYRD